MSKVFQDKGFAGIKACFSRAKGIFWYNEFLHCIVYGVSGQSACVSTVCHFFTGRQDDREFPGIYAFFF